LNPRPPELSGFHEGLRLYPIDSIAIKDELFHDECRVDQPDERGNIAVLPVRIEMPSPYRKDFGTWVMKTFG
jgi:hypothetical protein